MAEEAVTEKTFADFEAERLAGKESLQPEPVEESAKPDDGETPPEIEEDSETHKQEANEGDDTPDDKPKKKGGFQRRIDKLTQIKREVEAENERLRQQLAAKAAAQPAEKQTTSEGKPVVDKFDTYEEFLEALTDWKTEQRFQQQRKEDEQRRIQETQQVKASKLAELADAAREVHDDFDEILERGDSITISQALNDALLEVENLPLMQYHLAKTPAEVERLNTLSPLAVARELGKIEAQFETASPSKVTAPKKTPASAAPAPVKPVGGGTARSAPSLTTMEMSFADYEKQRKAQQSAR